MIKEFYFFNYQIMDENNIRNTAISATNLREAKLILADKLHDKDYIIVGCNVMSKYSSKICSLYRYDCI